MCNEKYPYISLLQIIGPVFVILGHSANGIAVPGFWYVFSKEWIYIFHMPLFFLISGYLFAFRGFLRSRTYKDFIKGKCRRLLIPYLFWNLLFFIPKYFLQAYTADSVPASIPALLKAFVFPRQNIWGHTWFLFGLFLIFVISPFIKKIINSGRKLPVAALLAACTVLYVLPISTEFFALSDLHKDLLFFVIGCLLGRLRKEQLIAFMKKYRPYFIPGAIVASVISLMYYQRATQFLFIPCTLILFSLLSVSIEVRTLPSVLDCLAGDSFAIYLLHWPVMLFVRTLLLDILNCSTFLTVLSVCISGWLLPIAAAAAVRKVQNRRIRKSLKYILGV